MGIHPEANQSSRQPKILATRNGVEPVPQQHQQHIASRLALRQLLSVLADSFMCSITLEIMSDPVMTADGHTYERRAIVESFATGNHVSPLTNLLLPNTILVP